MRNVPRQTVFNRKKILSKRLVTQLRSVPTYKSNIPQRAQNQRQNVAVHDDIDNVDDDLLNHDEYQFNYHETVHPFLSCTIHEALVAIYSFYTRHNVSWVALEHICCLVNFILGNDALPKSKYSIKKFFDSKKTEIIPTVHLECLKCKNYLGERNELCQEKYVMCNVCQTECSTDIKYLKNHFITLPIRPQIIQALTDNIKSGHFINQRQTTPHLICDIHDAEIYQNLINKMEGTKFITLTLSTDGAVVHKSPKENSFWPLHFIINEIELKHRFQRKNIICAAFSYGKTPDMSIFMRHFIQEVNEINENGGIEIKINENGETERFLVVPIAITTDSMAKPHVAKITQHNGHEGCPYCYHYGSLPDGSKTIKYSTRLNAESRTHEDSKTAMIEADQGGRKVRGYMGLSPILALDTPFDVVWQIVVDKMHSIDLGVIKKIFDLLLDKRNKNEA